MDTTIDQSARRAAHQAAIQARLAALRENLTEVFRDKPALPFTTLEIGSGHGHFLASYAAAHSDQWCLGLDIIRDRVARATRKRDRAGLKNLAFILSEATDFLESLPDGAVFDRVFVLFPDPWPKKRHHKNRLLGNEFFGRLARRCRPGARFHFRTDHRPYFDEVESTVAGHHDWTRVPAGEWPFEHETVFQQRAESFSSLILERT